MIIFLTVLGIFLSIILLYFNARSYASSIYLGIFFLLISLYNFNQFIILESKSVFWVSLIYLNIGFLSYLIGPMLFWYVRSVLTDDSRLKKNDFLHFLPMLIFLIATLPHMFSSWSHKAEIATKIVGDVVFLRNYDVTFLNIFFNSNTIYLSRPLLVLGYAAWSFILFLWFIKNKWDPKIFSNQRFMTKWLTFLFLFLSIWFIGQVLQLLELNTTGSVEVFYSPNILLFLSAAGLIGLLGLPFFFPTILYGLPRFSDPGTIQTHQGSAFIARTGQPDGPIVQDGKAENKFDANHLMDIHQKVESCMKDFQPYLQPECNLAYLSKQIDIPVHHLAFYFREEKKQTFNDYRNGWRIAHAKKLILVGKANELTLEAIGILSGFTNRNTFFVSFKKMEGVSPSEFLAQYLKE